MGSCGIPFSATEKGVVLKRQEQSGIGTERLNLQARGGDEQDS